MRDPKIGIDENHTACEAIIEKVYVEGLSDDEIVEAYKSMIKTLLDAKGLIKALNVTYCDGNNSDANEVYDQILKTLAKAGVEL
jgi:predicted nucleic-acid-binding protein